MSQHQTQSRPMDKNSPLRMPASPSQIHFQKQQFEVCLSQEVEQSKSSLRGHDASTTTNEPHQETELLRKTHSSTPRPHQVICETTLSRNVQSHHHTYEESVTDQSLEDPSAGASTHDVANPRNWRRTSLQEQPLGVPPNSDHIPLEITSLPATPTSGFYGPTPAIGRTPVSEPAFMTASPELFSLSEASRYQLARGHDGQNAVVQHDCPPSILGLSHTTSRSPGIHVVHNYNEDLPALCNHTAATSYPSPNHWAANTVESDAMNQPRQAHFEPMIHSKEIRNNSCSDSIPAPKERPLIDIESSVLSITQQGPLNPPREDTTLTIPLHYETPTGTRTVWYHSSISYTPENDPKNAGVMGWELSG